MTDPRTKFPKVNPPEQHQEYPGLDIELQPQSDIGIETYEGHGRLKGRKALITGGDSGIGAAVAVAYAKEGADVAIAYLPEEQPDADRVLKAIEDRRLSRSRATCATRSTASSSWRNPSRRWADSTSWSTMRRARSGTRIWSISRTKTLMTS